MLEFDFIIVGAGPAGCMVAGELATETDARVLLLEAGALLPPVPRRPAEYLKSFRGDLDWGLQTTAQSALAGRSLRWPRGRGVGGSSLINAMIWCPPTLSDLQMLIGGAGSGWTLESLQADVREIETMVRPEQPRWLSEAARRFLQSAATLGASAKAELSAVQGAGQAEGGGRETPRDAFEGEACIYRRVNRFGRRRTSGDLLYERLHEAKDRRPRPGGEASVQLRSATVDSIVWNGDRAAGVRFLGSGDATAQTVSARRGVVICAGTIHSPAILMRSGIGPGERLGELSIERRVDCEDVGAQMADHLVMPVVWSAPAAARFPTDWSVSDLAQWTYGGTGPLSSNLAEVGGFFSFREASDGEARGERRRVQLHVTPTDYLRYPQPAASAAMTIAVTDSAPRSRGRISLQDAHPHAPPVVEPNYFADRRDIAAMIAGVRFARRFAAESPLAGWCGAEQTPGNKRQDDQELARAVARYSQTLYHPVGTCRLGSDRGAVVSPDFRVSGTESLWVCDASVLPSLPSANPMALVLLLARRLARLLARQS